MRCPSGGMIPLVTVIIEELCARCNVLACIYANAVIPIHHQDLCHAIGVRAAAQTAWRQRNVHGGLTCDFMRQDTHHLRGYL
jgi:hypothetical protein